MTNIKPSTYRTFISNLYEDTCPDGDPCPGPRKLRPNTQTPPKKNTFEDYDTNRLIYSLKPHLSTTLASRKASSAPPLRRA